ncbi:ectoine/hydroxyectoine ABC transporter permease subunit EhuC [Prauserella muralis]|uniref:Ectoine/hydroxyectoine ABC transporter permease subunit EhuC n=1 Tax=Prauserella muralis TaxID=588067 RepID=A0A2V4ALS0_9PSEU|nr:ectoine/hydroxyectoine ABC transporter permease subunit EhuC [Prauserella muralis]PXY20953.1 ectoine/hydroxyectoine ABC transporter permease subunit EhuC [Prauserella muralis]TWE30015.1 polar amino acid transport system permease protein [Prauserella muralis]
MFDQIGLIFSTLVRGLPVTIAATLGGIALTVVLSFVAGLALLAPSRTVRFLSRVYVEGFRGTSEMVQLFWIYFVLPVLVGFELVPLFAGILVLGLNHGAYGAEIVRGAVQSVPKAQYEGAIALSLSPAQRMLRVILPQAVVEMLPSFNNLFIQLLKSTALLYFISAEELTERGQLLAPSLPIAQLVPIYVIELLFYLLLAVLITVGMRALERVGARRLGRRAPRRRSTPPVTAGGV